MHKKIALIALLILAIAVPAGAGHHEEMTDDPGWHGMFVWHELSTPVGDPATEFYTTLFGWTTEIMDMGEAGPYTTWKIGEKEVGGMMNMELPEGVHPHWMTYIAVDDIEASLKKVKELGGMVHYGPLPVEGIGTFGVCSDPQGATFSLMQFAMEFPYVQMELTPGFFVGDNLVTNDVEGALKFYGGLLGWEGTTMQMGELGDYTAVKRGNEDAAGIIPMPEGLKMHPYWQSYVCVESVEKMHARAIELGGKEYYPRTEIPGVGAFSVIGDPTGAAFSLIEFDEHATHEGCSGDGDGDCGDESGSCSEKEKEEEKEVKEGGCGHCTGS